MNKERANINIRRKFCIRKCDSCGILLYEDFESQPCIWIRPWAGRKISQQEREIKRAFCPTGKHNNVSRNTRRNECFNLGFSPSVI